MPTHDDNSILKETELGWVNSQIHRQHVNGLLEIREKVQEACATLSRAGCTYAEYEEKIRVLKRTVRDEHKALLDLYRYREYLKDEDGNG